MSALSFEPLQLSIAEYCLSAQETDRFKATSDDLTYLGFGLFGEVGGLLAAIKKTNRDTLIETETQFAAEELGDALWYLVSLARHAGTNPDDLGDYCFQELQQRFNVAGNVASQCITFEDIDSLVHRTRSVNNTRERLLCALAEATGNVTGISQNNLRNEEATSRARRLGNVLATMAEVSGEFGLRLSDIARMNLGKIKDRWPGQSRTYLPLFDEKSDVLERLPRKFEIKFIPRSVGGRNLVIQQLHGVNIGDPLTDNRHIPDGYRYHDVFHLAYIAHLGWSPVIRALLKLKRKSNPSIDENEDGARAIIIEEGIATWIFNHASGRSFYSNLEAGKLEYGLLKQVRSMVKGFEVQDCPLWQWELAILDGFTAFRNLLARGGGIVAVDMNAHTIMYRDTH